MKVRGFDLQFFESYKVKRKKKTKQAWRSVGSTSRLGKWSFKCRGNKVIGRTRVKSSSNRKSKFKKAKFKSPLAIRTPAGFLKFKGKPYREELRIYANRNRCEVVNVLDIENYLDGLVAAEFSPKWNKRATAAQVVAARTYALYRMIEARGKNKLNFDVDATLSDSAYDGSVGEDFRSAKIAKKTRGLVLTTGKKNAPVPIKAFYHSSCGGKTTTPQKSMG